MTDTLLDSEAFELLSRKVKADEESNRLAQQQLVKLNLNNRLNAEVVQRYAHLGEVVGGLITEVQAQNQVVQELLGKLAQSHDVSTEIKALAGVLGEVTEEISKRFDRFELSVSQRIGRLEDIELAALAGQQISPKKRTKTIKELKHEQRQRELQQHYMNLADLRLVAAKYGGINVPLDILNGIRHAEEAIVELEAESLE